MLSACARAGRDRTPTSTSHPSGASVPAKTDRTESLVPGENVIAWTALDADYLSAQPSCNTTTLDGPDLVLSYTAPENGFARVSMAKPPSARQVMVASSAACGTLEPELACVSEFTEPLASVETPAKDVPAPSASDHLRGFDDFPRSSKTTVRWG